MPQPAVQAPFAHVVPRPQPMPHPPQFALSLCGFTHVAPQSRSPAAHVQAPLTHVAPFGHWTPQPLQLSVLFVVFTQLLLQSVSPAPQTVVQTPPEQTGVPAGHTLPQAPQLAGSLCV